MPSATGVSYWVSSFAKRPMKGGLWTPYGISKHESELGLHQLATETGMEVVIIRPPPLDYGPGARSFVITGRRSRVTKPARHGPTPLRIAASGYIKGKSWDGRHRSASMRGYAGRHRVFCRERQFELSIFQSGHEPERRHLCETLVRLRFVEIC